MGLEIRAARPEEMAEFIHVVSSVMVQSTERLLGMRPEWTLCAFEDGNIATAYAAWPLTVRLNGNGIRVAGITMVSTHPVYRRRGNLSKIVTAHFELLHQEGQQAIAIMEAYRVAIYQRYGYAVVSVQNSYTVEPRHLEFAFPQPVAGSLHEMEDGEFQLLVDLYRSFREERTGYIHRGRATWEAGVLAPPPAGDVLCRVVYEESNEPQGYVIYTLEHGTGEPTTQQLAIRDLVWTTPSAYRAIWNHFASMDLVSNIAWSWVPGDDPLPHLLLEPRTLHTTSRDGIMARIIDVEQAMPKRGYQEEGTLIFEIIDDLCPWNQGRWKLETSLSGASISRTGAEPQVIMPVSTLAMLVFGRVSATEAARMNRLDVLKPDALSLWDIVMRTRYHPFCADIF